ncbi:MAG: tetraacyldisaccharide 4'-kinase, partial [Candidatus Sumerlaeaceae bacterium]|nr:tetraacyldisaccharide 4'-kinase [Candidatus Sumerlaeaceae bacterium]
MTVKSRPWLAPAAAVYGAVAGGRAALYRAGIFRSYRPPCGVVCVGNLTVGGTGKTPMVELVTKLLREMGFQPGIVSRGYKRDKGNSGDALLVSDGARILATAAEAGDEPRLLAELLPGTPVAVCANRRAAVKRLLSRELCDVIVMDDGFQHFALQRDMDIVLVDAAEDLAAMRLLPAGPLRESVAAGLARATAVVHTRAGGKFEQANRATVKRIAPNLPQFSARFVPDRLVSLGAAPDAAPLSILKNIKVFAFAGVASPGNFFESLRTLGAWVTSYALPDHF